MPTRGGLRVAIALLWLAATPAVAQDPATPWLDGLDVPTNMAFAPDGRLFFAEKATGQVRVVSADGELQDAPVVTVDVGSAGETGLLGIALHPSFSDGEPWMYLYLSDASDGMNRLIRVRIDGDGAAGAPQPLLTTVPAESAYHNGGDLLFGPDGMLYVSVGEAHQAERAQDPQDLGGKVLRLTPEGTPAPGNPLGDENRVYSLGHRNSFGLCADPSTGELWETENGPDVDDEVNRLIPGADYGWPQVTGDSGGRFTDPVTVFPDTVALTGCVWWRGELLVGSWNDGLVRTIDPVTGDASETFGFPAGVTDLQVGRDDALYVATADAIWRLDARGDGSGPARMAPQAGPDTTRGWLAVAAAIVLAAGLIARLAAGRSLRSRERR